MERLLIVVLCLVAAWPAAAQNPSSSVGESAEQRIKDLEQRIATLEEVIRRLQNRIEEFEREQERHTSQERALTDTPVSAVSTPGTRNWQERGNWRGLQQGMDMEQVKALLGDPGKIDVGPMLVYWHWGYPEGGSVHFDAREGKVLGWSEPPN